MKVDVEILKGNSKGKHKTISGYRARVLEKVGFLKIIRETPEPSKPVEQKSSNSYQTRMMQADTGSVSNAADHIIDSATEVDSAGQGWNAETHVATKLKNQDGTWRKKPGAKLDQ